MSWCCLWIRFEVAAVHVVGGLVAVLLCSACYFIFFTPRFRWLVRSACRTFCCPYLRKHCCYLLLWIANPFVQEVCSGRRGGVPKRIPRRPTPSLLGIPRWWRRKKQLECMLLWSCTMTSSTHNTWECWKILPTAVTVLHYAIIVKKCDPCFQKKLSVCCLRSPYAYFCHNTTKRTYMMGAYYLSPERERKKPAINWFVVKFKDDLSPPNKPPWSRCITRRVLIFYFSEVVSFAKPSYRISGAAWSCWTLDGIRYLSAPPTYMTWKNTTNKTTTHAGTTFRTRVEILLIPSLSARDH